MFFRYCLIFAFFILLNPSAGKATHIVGGELNYRFLGGNVYEITLKVYRDCFGGQALFDNPASIGFFDAQGSLVSATSAYITSQSRIPNLINSPCLTPPTNICYEVAFYTFDVNLPPIAGGYQIVYQRCCRNNSVLNVYNVQNTGATYVATIPDSLLVSSNSNPEFNLLPPTFICEDAPFTFDHSATDADGDSIVYDVCVPLRGGSPSIPQPQPPDAPPYTRIVWESPYTLANVFGGVPLSIDPVTGILTATPNASGQYVYGICAKEYRNGVYLGETKRDFQVNVVPCPMLTVASIFSPTIACGSLTADFVNQSYNAATYLWDFGDPTTFADTSTLKNPSWTYADTGDYTVTLVAYSAANILCNDTTDGPVNVQPEFLTDFTLDNIHCSPEFNFYDASFGPARVSTFWEWDLGDGTTSSDKDVTHTYQAPGQYEVRLVTSADSSCLDTLTRTIHVLQIPEADFSTELDTCTQTLATLNLSNHGAFNVWNFSGSWTGPAEQPIYQYQNEGVYQVTMVSVSDSACSDSITKIIQIHALPEANFDYDVGQCDSLVKFSNYSRNSVSYQWNFGDDIESTEYSPLHAYSLSGYVPVQLISTSIHSCRDTILKEIFFVSRKKAAFETSIDSCSGLVHFLNAPQNAHVYFWDFGDGTFSTDESPVHAYAENGTYTTLLTVNGETVCVDSISRTTVFESPMGELLFAPSAFTPNGDGLNDLFQISIFRPCETFSISIFNRWGQLIFEAEDASEAIWDGTFNNTMAEEGIYVYLLKSESQVKKGVAYLTR